MQLFEIPAGMAAARMIFSTWFDSKMMQAEQFQALSIIQYASAWKLFYLVPKLNAILSSMGILFFNLWHEKNENISK